MELILVSDLKPIEGHGKQRVQNIKKKILKDGLWTKPICIERTYKLVLDGMHRFQIAQQLDFKYIPCELYDYDDIDVWTLRPKHIVTVSLVIERALAGDIYPYKTVKHRFKDGVPSCSYSFDELRG